MKVIEADEGMWSIIRRYKKRCNFTTKDKLDAIYDFHFQIKRHRSQGCKRVEKI